jgi:mono/diheme cytochrome c family protein
MNGVELAYSCEHMWRQRRLGPFLVGVVVGVLLTGIVAAAAVRFGHWRVDAQAEPPAWETRLLRGVLDRALARNSTHPTNPTPVTDDRLLAGLKLYRTNCLGCHGGSLRKSSWGSTSFYPRVPQFGFEPPRRPDWQIFGIVKHGIRYTGMGAWSELMTDAEIWDVSAFLSRIQALPEPVEREWKRPPR